ncbi:MAG: protoporphyrinogen oxidase [Acidimicrobiia bacterium]|nr:protoporphyrinogen oxidase [Acidimicrobiia bacterium]
MSRPPRVAVVGGGITGLAAAFELARAGADVVLHEAANVLGGKVRTGPFAGAALDAGPDAFLARAPWARELCDEVGLADDLVAPATRHAYLWAGGELRPFPHGLLLGVPTDLDALARSGLLSTAGVDRVAEDLTRPDDAPPAGTDEAIGALVRRRLGAEALDRLVDPLLSGVFAGDVERLSAAAAAPQLAAAAASGPSLVRGARQALARAAALSREAMPPGGEPGGPAPVFLTVRGGLGRLVARLHEAVGAERTRLGSRVEGLRRTAGGYELQAGGGVEAHDAVLVASPAPEASRLLAALDPGAAAVLAGIEYASVALVSFAYPLAAVPRPLDGSGFLVPRSAGLLMTACSWSSSKWAHVGGDGTARLRVSAGRDGDDRIAALDDGALVSALRADLRTTMGIDAEPAQVRVTPWPASLPQYRPGHLDRLASLEASLAGAAPGVVATGAAFRGVGLPACIDQGRQAARRLLGRLG